MLHFAFAELELSIIQATCVMANRRSIGVLENLEFGVAERLPAGTVSRGHAWPERGVFELHRASWNRAG